MENLLVDGIEVTLSSHIRAQVSDYTVHNGKIWKIIGSERSGIKRSVQLYRDTSPSEEIWIKGDVNLFKIVKPTGYIRLK